VIGYLRVSTEEQANDGLSLTLQEHKVRGYCELYGLDLVRIETDAGVSAKSLEREALGRVLDDLGRWNADGIVVYKLDRLTRSIRDWAYLIERFFDDKAGRRLFSVQDSIDTRTAAGRMVLNLFMTVYQWERETIVERTKDAMQGKIARGERAGRIRFGYDLAGDGRTLVPNPRQQEAITFMKQWRDENKTYREMIELLTELGIETKEPGAIWRPGVIHRILTRPID
jgi:site-specific DNA recombinase